MSQSGRGVFSGYLDRTLPKDGKVKKSGVVNLKSPYKFVGFQRRVPYDWSEYNTMRMRVRGDGRTYYLHLKLHFRYQDFQADNFSYPLHTRGGPYWQEVQIPFSRYLILVFRNFVQFFFTMLIIDRLFFYYQIHA